MSLSTIRILKLKDIRLKKSLGQNFLVDENIVKKIVKCAEVASNDIVIEVGAGIGTMTSELAKVAKLVIAIEIDKYLIPVLKENLLNYQNIEIVNQDIMKVLLNTFISQYKLDKEDSIKVVANLPYYITTPIMMKFLEDGIQIDSMVLMIQKEVAHRIVANPGGKDYGALSVAVQYYSKSEILFNVSAESFIPKPEVDSSVIKLKMHKTPPVLLLNKDIFFKTIKAAFNQRRKTILNALANSGCFGVTKEELKYILGNIGITENERGERLSIDQFAQLANEIYKCDKTA